MRALALSIVLAGCSKTPAPARPVAEEFVEVGFPPPPAEVEEREAELAGRPECTFVDGHHEWRGKRWQWQRGEWVVPPAGCSYALGLLMWSRPPNPRLYYTPPRWYPASGKGRCDAPTSCETPRRPSR
jgi:hypothetical protein